MGQFVVGRQRCLVPLVHVNGVGRHMLVLVTDVLVSAPVQVENARVRVKSRVIAPRQVGVLHDSAHNMRQVNGVLPVEHVEARAERLNQLMQIVTSHVLVLFVAISNRGDHLLSGRSVGLLQLIVDSQVALAEFGSGSVSPRLKFAFLSREPSLKHLLTVVIAISLLNKLVQGADVLLKELSVVGRNASSEQVHVLDGLLVTLVKAARRPVGDLLVSLHHMVDFFVASRHKVEFITQLPVVLHGLGQTSQLDSSHGSIIEDLAHFEYDVRHLEVTVGLLVQVNTRQGVQDLEVYLAQLDHSQRCGLFRH